MRNFKESDVIADVFTTAFGLVTVVCRAAKRRSKKPALHYFKQYIFTMYGQGEMKTSYDWEESGVEPIPLMLVRYKIFYQLLYINELLLTTLKPEDPHSSLFNYYKNILQRFRLHDHSISPAELLTIELTILKHIGYELSLNWDARARQPINSDKQYQWFDSLGFCESQDRENALLGSSLFALYNHKAHELSIHQIKLMRKIVHRVLRVQYGSTVFKAHQSYLPDKTLISN